MNKAPSPLEQRARALLAGREFGEAEDKLTPAELLEVVHELHVHQIELELQNEELRDAYRRLEESQEALATSERRYHDLFDRAPVGYLRLDRSGLIQEANNTAAEILLVETSRLRGRKFSDFIAPVHQDTYYLQSQAAKRSECPAPVWVEVLPVKGEVRDVEISARSIPGDSEEFSVAILDVTDRERAEAEIYEIERQRRVMADALPLAVCQVSADGTFVLCNRAFRSLYELSTVGLEGQPVFEVFDESTYAAWRDHIKDALAGRGNRFEGEVTFPRIGKRSVSILFAPDFGSLGETRGFYATIDDRTGLKQARSSLRAMASQAALAEERERKLLANDLHDDAGQLLSLASIKLRSMDEQVSDTELAKSVHEVATLIREARESISTLSFEMSPPLLYDLGFTAAIEWLVENLNARYGLVTEISKVGDVPTLDEALLVTLFRVVRELLINVAKHSGTNQASLSISGDPDGVGIVVADQGAGFERARSENGYGLRSVIDRIEALGGRIQIDSMIDDGAKISLRLPAHGRASV